MTDALPEFPNLFEYDNYRKFVADAFASMKGRDKKFSLRYFARLAGFSSHNSLKHVISGKNNLAPDSIDKIAKGFKFNSEQTQFFRNLVYLNQAKTNEERQHYSKEILRSRTFRKIHPLMESQYQFFASWYVSAIREMVTLPGFNDDPKWIAERLYPPIKPQEAERAIDDLLKLGLLIRDENHKLIQAAGKVSTPNEVSSSYVSNWHKEYLKKAAESIDQIPRDLRDISALSFTISREDIKKVKEMALRFRQEVELMATSNPNRDMLYQLNIQFFPLGKSEGGKDS